MFKRRIMFVILAVFLFACADKKAENNIKTNQRADSTVTISDSAELLDIPNKVIAYYFYTTKRCPSCRKIEAHTREAIETGFATEIAEGQLEFLMINTDDEENRHCLDDYGLFTKSVIISKIRNGQEAEWKNLEKIWELLGDKKEFIGYVQSEVGTYLKSDK